MADAFEGLWGYVTIGGPGRKPWPVAGLFYLGGGRFVQQALNIGEPFERQVAQAHAGTYRLDGRTLVLLSEVGLVVDPAADPSVVSRRDAEHRVTFERRGGRLTLTFGTGTIQTLERMAGPDGDVVRLDRGGLALVEGRFVLAAEGPGLAIGGSGIFKRRGGAMTLTAERWFEVRDGRVAYDRERTVETSFGGDTLAIRGGPTFKVIGPSSPPIGFRGGKA